MEMKGQDKETNESCHVSLDIWNSHVSSILEFVPKRSSVTRRQMLTIVSLALGSMSLGYMHALMVPLFQCLI